MILSEIEKLLKSKLGLDPDSIGRSAIRRALEQRLKVCRMDDRNEYLAVVRSSEKELDELIETVVVSETWFFRDCEAFRALATLVRSDAIWTKPLIRILSLPCATGEEPYSIAMALMDAGVADERIQIVAVDISARALAVARKAYYSKNSFRGKDFSFRDRYFVPKGQGFVVSDRVRSRVSFSRGNLLDGSLLGSNEGFDAVFCRNLLIYLDADGQSKAARILDRLLASHGMLFMGPAEASLMLSHEFVSAKIPLAFAFRKASAVPAGKAERDRSLRRPVRRPSLPQGRKPVSRAPVAQMTPKGPVESGERAPGAAGIDLDTGKSLADQGRLAEAAEIYRAYLKQNKNSAQAFYLLGLVRDASGASHEAGELYRKALYLEPEHYEALMHLALIKQKAGDKAGAEVLRSRARRAREVSEKLAQT